DGDERAGLGFCAKRGPANRNRNQTDGDQTDGCDETNQPLVRLPDAAEAQRTSRSRREKRRRVEGRAKRRSFPLPLRDLDVVCASAAPHASCTLSNYHVIHLAPPEFLKPEGASRVSVSNRELNKWRREAEGLRKRLRKLSAELDVIERLEPSPEAAERIAKQRTEIAELLDQLARIEEKIDSYETF